MFLIDPLGLLVLVQYIESQECFAKVLSQNNFSKTDFSESVVPQQ